MAKLQEDEIGEIKTLFKKYLAWNIVPLSYNCSIKILRLMGVTSDAACKQLLKSMQENDNLQISLTIRYISDKMCYLLSSDILHYLWLQRNESGQEFKKYGYESGYTVNYLSSFRSTLLQWAATGTLEDEIIESWPVDKYTLSLFRAMAYSEEWGYLYPRLSVDVLFAIIDQDSNDWHLWLNKPLEFAIEKVYIKNDSMPAEVTAYFKESYSFCKYVLSGRINEIPET